MAQRQSKQNPRLPILDDLVQLVVAEFGDVVGNDPDSKLLVVVFLELKQMFLAAKHWHEEVMSNLIGVLIVREYQVLKELEFRQPVSDEQDRIALEELFQESLNS